MSKPIYVRDIWNYFGYRRVVGDDKSLDRPILEGDVNRPGLELSGYFEKANHRIIVMGEKEITYINNFMSEQRQKESFEFLTSDKVPMILISRDLPCPKILYDIAYKKNFPIFSSYASTNSLVSDLLSYIEEYFSQTETLHGVLLKVYGHGVLLTGESGIGKSEIALELVKNGHILIADDRVDIFRAHNRIYGEAPEILRDVLELRGVGVLNVRAMFGYMASDARSEIETIIELKRQSDDEEYDHLGLYNQHYESHLGVNIIKMVVPIREGRSAAAIIEAAVTRLIMKKNGDDPAERFNEKLLDYIDMQKEGK